MGYSLLVSNAKLKCQVVQKHSLLNSEIHIMGIKHLLTFDEMFLEKADLQSCYQSIPLNYCSKKTHLFVEKKIPSLPRRLKCNFVVTIVF